MMLELTDYICQLKQRKPQKADFSLSGTLEVSIGNYFVSGEGSGNQDFHWLTVYYDATADTSIEAVKTLFSNVVAYISSDYQWSFVLNSHFRKFTEDTSDFGLTYISVPNFQCETLKCSRPDLLPCAFSKIIWLNDDFLNYENIPFDYAAFALIDDGVKYLNPNHFSVTQLIRIMET